VNAHQRRVKRRKLERARRAMTAFAGAYLRAPLPDTMAWLRQRGRELRKATDDVVVLP
jgi:hypothetical protein